MTRRPVVAMRRWTLALLAAATISLAGCGGASTANVQNPPPPPASNISVSFQSPPPQSIAINTTANLTANVNNDPSNAGVDWALPCQSKTAGACGSLSNLHTPSGQPTTFTPPATLTGNNQMVNIVAYASADHTQNVVASISVSAFGSNLKGNYVFQVQGIDSNSLGPYQLAGVVVLDGNGGVLAGEQTVNFFDPNAGILLSKADAITAGSYFLGPDGRGTISVTTQDADVAVNGTETFSLVFLSSSHVLIAQTDTTEAGTGTMDLQTSTTAPSAGYAFVLNGTDVGTASPVAMGGVFNIDSPGNISGKGSIIDQNLSGTLTQKQALSGTVSSPDALGAISLNLLVPGFTNANAFTFTGYLVDATHVQLIESDNGSGAGSGATSGIAIGQGSATGTFTTAAALIGSYVFGVVGEDLTVLAPNSMTTAGMFTADGNGNLINTYLDQYLQANGFQGTSGAQISAQFSSFYSLDTKGTGRVRAAFSHFVPPPKPAFQPLFILYVTGNGGPVLVLDGSDTGLINYPSLGVGIAYPQTSSLAFSGDYGFSLTQQNGGDNQGTGQMNAAPATNTLAGVLDTNSGFNPTFANPLTGTFAPPPANGRFAGTLSSQVVDFNPFSVEFYAIDSSHGFFVETDLVNPNSASGVVSFGYYASRTPVCAGCP